MLLLGLGSAAFVYWLGTRSPDFTQDPSMAGFDKAQRRQMGEFYGPMGLQMQEFIEDLKQPGTQAKIIVTVSILFAAGCFYLASRLGEEEELPGD